MFLLAQHDSARRQARLNRWAQIRRVGRLQYVLTRAAAWGGAGIIGDVFINFVLGRGFRWFGILVFALAAPIAALLSCWGRETDYVATRLHERTKVLPER
jgi:hypothetical protein